MATPAVTGGFSVVNGDTATATYLNSLCQSIVTIAGAGKLTGNPTTSTSQSWQEISISSNLQFTGTTLDLASAVQIGAGGSPSSNTQLALNGSNAANFGSRLIFQINGAAKAYVGTDASLSGSGSSTGLSFLSVSDPIRFYTSSAGLAATIDQSNNVTLTGNLSGVSSTFSGNVGAVSGTFSGNVSAVSATFSGLIGTAGDAVGTSSFVVSSATPANAPGLSVSLASSTTYSFTAYAAGTGGAGGYNVGVFSSSQATSAATNVTMTVLNSTNATNAVIFTNVQSLNFGFYAAPTAYSGSFFAKFDGSFTTAAATTFTMQFGLQTATSATSALLAGSYLKVWKS